MALAKSTRRALGAASLGSTGMLLLAQTLLRSDKSLGSEMTKQTQQVGGVPSDLSINVRQYGARGDGIHDDAKALNEAVDELRRRQHRICGYNISCSLVFPTGIYMVKSSINMTGLHAINLLVNGQGSVIIGGCKEKPVIDALDSRWLTIRDLNIIGDSSSPPSVGLQIGVLTSAVADDHKLDNLKILGQFSLTCLYNRSGETSQFDHLLLWNDHPKSYCLIQDGLNFFEVTSAFITADLPARTDLSFNENIFISCDFRHGAGGIPVWLGDTSRHAFVRCYSAGTGDASFFLFSGSNGHRMLAIDCHCETYGLSTIFQIDSLNPEVTVRD